MELAPATDALAGKSLVVIGGTTGLGASAARAFLAAGASGVVVTGRNPDSAADALQSLGAQARAITGDACDSGHAPEAIALAIEAFGRFDGLYHVAGVVVGSWATAHSMKSPRTGSAGRFS